MIISIFLIRFKGLFFTEPFQYLAQHVRIAYHIIIDNNNNNISLHVHRVPMELNTKFVVILLTESNKIDRNIYLQTMTGKSCLSDGSLVTKGFRAVFDRKKIIIKIKYY